MSDKWYRRTEFWFTLVVTLLGASMMIIPVNTIWYKLAGAIVTVGAQYGYTRSRGDVKAAAAQAPQLGNTAQAVVTMPQPQPRPEPLPLPPPPKAGP